MKRLPAAAFALMPGSALACALPPSVILTLPTGHYITGAALTVALTATLGALTHRLPQLQAHLLHRGPDRWPLMLSSCLGFLAFAVLVGVGVFGANDPLHNLMTLVFWTGVWIALPFGSMVLGNLWRPVSPWTAPVRSLRTALGWQGSIGLSRLGHWPAALGMAGFSWFQIVSLAPDDPGHLARVALAYWAVILVLAVAEGEDWLEKGEFLTVFFAMISRIAPFWRERSGGQVATYAGWPGAQVMRMPPLDLSQMAFITLTLGALSFEGLAETFWWLGLIGENPLEFTGRSAVMGVNTAGLLAAWAVTALGLWGGLRLSRWLAGGGFDAGPVMLSFLAIAAGYHVAHFFVTLITTGQYTLWALNDPLFRGDEFLGLPPFFISFGFLTDPFFMRGVYAVQFAAILGAHLLAVVLTLKLAGPGLRARGHLPMTLLMTGYTIFGLWLMSTARGV
ncbi:MAG: hypothetical protein IH625_01740 [Rhodobacteraceae bacterium]|nr:hypothetical protein [Paracoccaceae bacterium]